MFDRCPAALTSKISRRAFLKMATALMAMGIVPYAQAAGKKGLHGLSIFGDLKYGPDFSQLDYVNIEAPKGGKFTYIPDAWGYNQNPQTFNTMNGFAAKGDGPMGVEICFDSLVSGTADEPDSVYGLLAKTIDVSKDRNTFTYHLRPEARFANDKPVTAEDVVWSIETLIDTTKGHPSIGLHIRNLRSLKVLDEHIVEMVFNGKQSLFEPLSVAGLPIMEKAFFDNRSFTQNNLKPIIGSGAYEVGNFKAGQFIEYKRRDDYWAKDLPLNRGQGNFDIIRVELFRDPLVAFQAFTKGDIDFRSENTARNWAQKYDFDAVKQGKIKRELFPREKSATMQAFSMNTRRPQFSDQKTRQAMGLAFDFEWLNENQFFGAYQRSITNFAQSTFSASGPLLGKERELLEPYADELDPSVFEEAIVPPVSNGSGRDRTLLRKASKLLKEAGWQRKDGILKKADGTAFKVEFLLNSQVFERVLAGFIENLKALGIDAKIRIVDAAQYQDRVKTFDFDMVVLSRRFSATPLEGFRSAFSSHAADIEGSGNYAGVKLKAVDAMIEKVESATSREDMETAARALDRILRAHFYTIPNWHITHHRVAYWDKFSRPDVKKPDYGFPYLTTWWYDRQKAARL